MASCSIPSTSAGSSSGMAASRPWATRTPLRITPRPGRMRTTPRSSGASREAERNRVLPLLGGLSVLFGQLPPLPTVTRFTFAGDVQNVQRGMVPRVYGRSYAIEAELEVPEAGAEGVIVANADFIGGVGVWGDSGGGAQPTCSLPARGH